MENPFPPSDGKVLPADLEAFCVEAMRRYGLRDEDARLAARIFVTTDTWGVHTHGTRQLRSLLKNFPVGRLDATATSEVIKEGQAFALVDGHNAMPPVTAHRAMSLAIKKAGSAGIGYVGVIHTSHFGAAGYYANLAAEQNMIGVAMCNADPLVAVPGSRGRVLGTNPLAYAVPCGEERPVFLDIATSATAANKVIRAKALGQPIPAGWIVDGEGVPTTDPAGFPAVGALMPMAGHKGYGLALLVEVLCGVLTGASVAMEQPSWVPGLTAGATDAPVNQGQTFIAINVAAILPVSDFQARMDGLNRYIHAAPKARDAERIFLPGEMEWARREVALREGMILPPDVVDSLRGLAQDVGLAPLPT
jgi:ureidoglycolate dehydrogenase (NAD+)